MKGRPRKRIRMGWQYKHMFFVPPGWREEIIITDRELEAMRLVDYEGLSQEEAAERMGVSRGTVWRLLTSARKKVTEAIIFGKKLVVAPEEMK